MESAPITNWRPRPRPGFQRTGRASLGSRSPREGGRFAGRGAVHSVEKWCVITCSYRSSGVRMAEDFQPGTFGALGNF